MTEDLTSVDNAEECEVCKRYVRLSDRPLRERIHARYQQFQERSAVYSEITSKYGIWKMSECNLFFWNVWANNGKKIVERYLNQKSDCVHHAIIIVNNEDRNIFIKNTPTYAGGIDLLIDYFVTEPITPFQIYICKDPKSFEIALKNPNTKYLWIFGHGDRHGVDFGNRVYYPYCRLSKVSKNEDMKKVFIAQLHCSSGEGKPLWEYLSENQGIYSGKDRFPLENREDIIEWIRLNPKNK
jgi:hypothetical protein